MTKLRVLEWIDFSDVNPEVSVGAFDLDLGNGGDLATFRTYMNIEPSALMPSVFSPDDDEVFHPSFKRQYDGVPPAEGDSLVSIDGWFPGVQWEVKKAPDSYILTDPDLMAIRVFCHELAHGFDFERGHLIGTKFSDMPEWRNISGWGSGDAYSLPKLIPQKWASDCGPADYESPISFYGCTAVYEDFAETYSCYMLNPIYLQTYYPKRYGFMETYVKDYKPYS